MFVSDLRENAMEDDLKALFKDVRLLSRFVCKLNLLQTRLFPSAVTSERLR